MVIGTSDSYLFIVLNRHVLIIIIVIIILQLYFHDCTVTDITRKSIEMQLFSRQTQTLTVRKYKHDTHTQKTSFSTFKSKLSDLTMFT